MSFWTGLLAGATGHQPGAFKGFKLKDILDKDMWEREQRIRQQPGWDEGLGRYAKVGEPLFNDITGEPMMTNWYKGMGKPEFMGPRVGAPGVVPVEEDETILRNRPDRPPMAISRDRPFPIPRRDADVPTPAPKQSLRPSPQPLKQWPTFDNPYRRPATLMNIPAGGRQRVPSLYDPYLSGLRSDQMGAAGFNPLEKRMHQSRIDQQGLTTAGQYRKGLQDAVGTLGDAFLPPNVMEQGREIWGDLRDFYYPGKDASSSQADKVTKIKKSADPTEYDTEEITITEKLLGPSGHRMGAFKDTAADMWKNIREDDIIKYWMNQFRGN